MSRIAIIAAGSILWFAVFSTALNMLSVGLTTATLTLIPATILILLAFRVRNLRRHGRMTGSSVSSSHRGQTVLG